MQTRILIGESLRRHLESGARHGNLNDDFSCIVRRVLDIRRTRPQKPAGIVLSGLPGTGKAAALESAIRGMERQDFDRTALAFGAVDGSLRELFHAFAKIADDGVTRLCIEDVELFPDFMEHAELFRWEDFDYPDAGVSFGITCGNPICFGVLDRLGHMLNVSSDVLQVPSGNLDDFLWEKNGFGSSPAMRGWRDAIGHGVLQALEGPHAPDFRRILESVDEKDLPHEAARVFAQCALSTIWRALLRCDDREFARNAWSIADRNFREMFGGQLEDQFAEDAIHSLLTYGGLLEKTIFAGKLLPRPWRPVMAKATLLDAERYAYEGTVKLDYEAACPHPALRLGIVREILGGPCFEEAWPMMRREVLAETLRTLAFVPRLPDGRHAFLPLAFESVDEEHVAARMLDMLLFECTSGATRLVIVPDETLADEANARFFLDYRNLPNGYSVTDEVVILHDGPTEKPENGVRRYDVMDFLSELVETHALDDFFDGTAGRQKFGFEEMYGDALEA